MTERQIAARLGMSRTPVREAVRRLEGEGTLERQRSGALVVRPYSMEEFLQRSPCAGCSKARRRGLPPARSRPS